MPREECIIVGAGPIGIACALSARRRGIDPLLIEAGAIVNSIVHYPTGMIFFTTPERLEIGTHPVVCSGPKPTREEALMYYRGVVRSEQLRVRTYTRLVAAERSGEEIRCDVESERGSEELRCEKLVLATGYFDHPNFLGVPGEDLPHVRHYYDEGHRHYGRDVVVVGGKNSAVEAALDLFRSDARPVLDRAAQGGPRQSAKRLVGFGVRLHVTVGLPEPEADVASFHRGLEPATDGFQVVHGLL